MRTLLLVCALMAAPLAPAQSLYVKRVVLMCPLASQTACNNAAQVIDPATDKNTFMVPIWPTAGTPGVTAAWGYMANWVMTDAQYARRGTLLLIPGVKIKLLGAVSPRASAGEAAAELIKQGLKRDNRSFNVSP